ncbi:MAG TPA: ABC transporter ATP-binding protein [Gaiellaceae bacterium]|nr:ABC transporter ATP-binding protein [Gaiellaceae bacterium]
MTGVAISAVDVHKTYGGLPLEHLLRRLAARGAGSRGRVHALRGVSFEIRHGEVVGIVGGNGAGKSTLLRIVAGLSPPTSGTVAVDGTVHAVLEIATGLLRDRTGRENIHYMGALYGSSPDELQEREQEIADFAGLGPFIDHPVRSYSSGMKSRLAFSIVTSGDFDVLLIDEALSVGDVGFALRCRQRIRELCRRGATVVLVSHVLQSIREMCDRVLWLHEGRIAADGDPDEVVEQYRAVAHEQAQREFARRFALLESARAGSGGVSVEHFAASTAPGGRPVSVFRLGDPLVIDAVISSDHPQQGVRARLDIVRVDGFLVFRDERELSLADGTTPLAASLGPMRLGRYTYRVRLELSAADGGSLARAETAFAVEDHEHAYTCGYYQELEWSLSA